MLVKTATISKNRQIAIPTAFGLETGEKVRISLDKKTGDIIIRRTPNPTDRLFGIAKDLNYSSDQFLAEKQKTNLKRNKKLSL